MTETIRCPTGEECDKREPIVVDGKTFGFYTWYPQMGGYSSYCAVLTVVGKKEGFGNCFEALVWSDGEFPFGDGDEYRKPAEIHHCSADQFMRFGNEVLAFQKGGV